MKEIIVPIPVYKFRVYVWICTVKEFTGRYSKTWYGKQKHEIELQDGGGKFLYADGIDPVIWVDSRKKKPDLIAGLAHEILHTISYLLYDRGARFDHQNHEFFTYLLEYIMKRVLEEMKI